jgi:hypothetical protein
MLMPLFGGLRLFIQEKEEFMRTKVSRILGFFIACLLCSTALVKGVEALTCAENGRMYAEALCREQGKVLVYFEVVEEYPDGSCLCYSSCGYGEVLD